MRPSPPSAATRSLKLKFRQKKPSKVPSPYASTKWDYRDHNGRTSGRTTSKQCHFNHLIHHPIPMSTRGFTGRSLNGTDRTAPFVHWEDRIMFWNIAPGDKVMIANSTKEERGKMATVWWVDRQTNQIALADESGTWTTSKPQANYFRGPAIRKTMEFRTFEYEDVRLLKTDKAPNGDIYYEHIREVEHFETPIDHAPHQILSDIPEKDRPSKVIGWRRVGTPYSIWSREPVGVEEDIPWPEKPAWNVNVAEAETLASELKQYATHLEQKAQTYLEQKVAAAAEEHSEAGENAEIEAKPLDPLSTPYGGEAEVRKIQDQASFPNLFTSAKDAWRPTFDHTPYSEQTLLWSSDPKYRHRFPEAFIQSSETQPLTSSLTSNLVDFEAYVPELNVPEWEVGGHHWFSRKAKILSWEKKMDDIRNAKIEQEFKELWKGVVIAGETTTEAELRADVELANSFTRRRASDNSTPTPESRAAAKAAQVAQVKARQRLDSMHGRFRASELRAALALLPELERFNSERMQTKLEHLSISPTVEGDAGATSEKTKRALLAQDVRAPSGMRKSGVEVLDGLRFVEERGEKGRQPVGAKRVGTERLVMSEVRAKGKVLTSPPSASEVESPVSSSA